MKEVTLLAIISICGLVFINLSNLFLRYFSFSGGNVFGILEIFAYVGLLPFFIKLYKNQ